MKAQKIDSLEQYHELVNLGLEPLFDYQFFKLDIHLRVHLQNKLFGQHELSKGDITKANDKFYRWIWDHKIHVCEETMQPIKFYSAVNISHILTRGAHPEMAHDPRNANILIFEKHNQWETGQRTKMRIYPLNMYIIQILKSEYESKNKIYKAYA